MKILMIGFDTDLVRGVENNESLRRHIKYADWLKNKYSNGQLVILVAVSKKWSAEKIVVNNSLSIYPIPASRLEFVFKAAKKIKEILQREKFDIVTTQKPFDDGLLGVWLKRKYNLGLNVQIRSSFIGQDNWIKRRWINRFTHIIAKWVLMRADTIRVISLGEKERLAKIMPDIADKIFYLHPFVDKRMFGEMSRTANFPYFLYVGRLVEEKNIPLLLEAFSKAKKRGLMSNLIIAGEGPLATKLMIWKKDIKWLGNLSIDGLKQWYHSTIATILPSYYEGFGKVIAESFLCGAPCIVTPFVSAPELVINNKTGFVLSSFSDSDELVEKMFKLENNLDLAREMGRRAKKHIEKYLLNESEYADQLIKIWEKTKICVE